MKLQSIPTGMVVTKKTHLGRSLYKIKRIDGFYHSVNDYKVRMKVLYETVHHVTSVMIDLSKAFNNDSQYLNVAFMVMN